LSEGTSETTQEGTIQVETPQVETPEFNVEETLPEIEEGLPEVDTTLKKTRGGFAKTEPSFSEMEYGSKAPSQYESFKKVLEQNYGGEIIGTGAEAFVRTPEMIAEAKKNAEFIGEYEPSGITPKKEEDEDIIKLRKEIEDEYALKEKEDLYFNNLSELYKEISNIEKKGPIEGDDEKILKSLNDRVNKTIFDIENLGEEETPEEKIKSIGLIDDKGLAPIKPTLDSLPVPEKEEKTPLKERLKEGIGGLKEKLKVKKEEEKPIAAVPEIQEEFVIKDKEGNIIGKSGSERAARLKGEKFAGGKTESMGGFTVEKQTVTPQPSETPAVGVEKAAAEAEEKTTFKEKLKEGIGNLAQKGKEKVKEKVELVRKEIDEVLYPEEQVNKIETPAVGVEQVTSEIKEPKTLREKIEEGADKLSGGIEKFAGKLGKKFEGGNLKSKIDEIRGKIKPQEEESKIEPVKQDMFPLSKGFDGPFYEMKDGKLQMRDPYEMLDEKNKKEEGIKPESIVSDKDKLKLEFDEQERKDREEKQQMIREALTGRKSEKTQQYLDEERKKTKEKLESLGIKPKQLESLPKEESGYLKMLDENDKKAIPSLTSKSGKPVNLDETEKIEPKLPTEETKPFSISDIKLSDFMSEDDGTIVEPAEVFPTEDEVRQNKEKEETKARSFAYLEELRLREQTPTVPETPAKGIEKIAQLGQKFEGKIGRLKGKLFGKKEEEESSLAYYEPGISTEEPYISEGIEEASTEDYGTLAEETESEVTPPQAIEESVPSVPEPAVSPFGQLQDIMGQGGGEQAAAQGETTQNINISATIEIVGNAEFAKLIDPRQFQQKIESIVTTSIGKPQIAQKFNSATSTEAASMGVKDTKRRRY